MQRISMLLIGALTFMLFNTQCQEKSELDCESQELVSVLLDGKECFVNFIQPSDKKEFWKFPDTDAIVIIYSVTDKSSFRLAKDCMETSRKKCASKIPVILVGNKNDIVRKRTVSEKQGKDTATNSNSKYIETSALLNHNVDELLVGIVKQIRIYHKWFKRQSMKKHQIDKFRLKDGARDFLNKLFKGKEETCDNLLVP